MRTMERGCCAALMIVAGAFGAGCGDDTGTDAEEFAAAANASRFAPVIAAIEAERQASGVPGVAVAIVEKGRVTFARGFGSKEPARGNPVRPTTLFRIGSDTKMLTAIALLQLVQQGRVDLDAPITRYLPAFHLSRTPAPVADITARMLLTHTSGLHDFLEVDAPPNERDDDALARFLTGRYGDEVGYVQSPPGAFFAYANPGYMLAGLLAQTVSRVPYRRLMHDRVLAPLGMTRTFFLPSEVIADGDFAKGQTCYPDASVCAPDSVRHTVLPDSYDNPWARPAGYAWSSVLDLAKAATFLLHGNGRVLRRDLSAAMTTAQAPMAETAGLSSYGFGVGVSTGFALAQPAGTVAYYPLTLLSHSGAIPGYSATLACLPARDFCFITLASGDQAFFTNSLVTAIARLVDLPAPGTVPDVAPRPARFPAYAGTYVDPFVLGPITVTNDQTGVSLRAPTIDPTGIIALTPTLVDNFVTADGSSAVTFIPDRQGVYTYLYSPPFVATRV